MPADAAAYTCVPGFQHRIKEWLQSLPPETAPSREDLVALGAVPVPGNAGDLVRNTPLPFSPDLARMLC